MLDQYFKTEDRARGEALLRSVSLNGGSDSGVRAFVDKCKVTLMSEGIESESFTAACTCANGRKGRLCPHIWAVVLKLDGSDFLSAKTEIQGAEPVARPVNARQAEYRKQQAEKHKARLKEIRREKKKAEAPSVQIQYPPDVEDARGFFAANGFALEPLDLEAALHAKKLLSRVFHPDKGGSHEEVIELNRHFSAIEEFLQS